MLQLKYSLNSQKPASLTCDAARLPEPTASTIRLGSTPESGAATIGARMPAAARPATVAEPTHTRMATVTSQARISGSSAKPVNCRAISLSTCVAVSTSLNGPEPPMTSRIGPTSTRAAV